VANQKGGIGKTTTAVALAHGLARRGYTTVLVDLDAQGNAATCLGLKPGPALLQLVMGLAQINEVLVEARPLLWFIGSDTRTANLKIAIAMQEYERETVVAKVLRPLECDFVIFDTGPGRDVMHQNAHHAAHEVVIPAAVDHLALIGVGQEFETLKAVREQGHDIEVTAILPTFYDQVTRESAHNLQELSATFGDLVLPPVPRYVKLREAPAYGRTVWEHIHKDHPVALAYQGLIERVLHV
jgi:chromosome partitioning protein